RCIDARSLYLAQANHGDRRWLFDLLGNSRPTVDDRHGADRCQLCAFHLQEEGCFRPRREGSSMMYRRISADCHIDLPWLPPDLFVSEAPQSLRSLMPYVVHETDRSYWTTHDGMFLGLLNGVGPRGNPYVPGRNAQTDRIASTG